MLVMKVDKKTGSQNRNVEPWPDLATARSFLIHLVDGASHETVNWAEEFENLTDLADWIIEHEIGPLAYYRFQALWPELSARLQKDAFAAIAENSLHFDRLRRISEAFNEAQIPFVLLKGAALAHICYPDPTLRTMSDIDMWVQSSYMARAYEVMKELGFRALGHPERPPQLQLLYQGEIQFYDKQDGLIELHWAPISGWQVKNTTVIDSDAIWARKQILEDRLAGTYVLANEDAIIQLALHTAINHRFRLTAVRSFIDIALTAKTTAVSWPVVAERAIGWRVATAVYCTLNLAQTMMNIPGIEGALVALRPSRLRRFILNRFVSVESILKGDEKLGDPMQNNRIGYLFLLFLIDRPIDVVKLFWQAIWPSRDWLAARYGEDISRWRHMIHMVRRGRV